MTITRAMILSAGYGTRMRAISPLPKPLLPLGNHGLVDHLLSRFFDAGVQEIVINLHHQAQSVQSHIEKKWAHKKISFSREARLLGTGGGILRALPHFEGAPFFVSNCDSLWENPSEEDRLLARLAEAFGRENGRKKRRALLLLTKKQNTEGYGEKGDFTMNRQGRLSFSSEGDYFYTGLQILHPALFQSSPALPPRSESFPIHDVWRKAQRENALHGLCLKDARWIHAGIPEGMEAAQKAFREGRLRYAHAATLGQNRR